MISGVCLQGVYKPAQLYSLIARSSHSKPEALPRKAPIQKRKQKQTFIGTRHVITGHLINQLGRYGVICKRKCGQWDVLSNGQPAVTMSLLSLCICTQLVSELNNRAEWSIESRMSLSWGKIYTPKRRRSCRGNGHQYKVRHSCWPSLCQSTLRWSVAQYHRMPHPAAWSPAGVMASAPSVTVVPLSFHLDWCRKGPKCYFLLLSEAQTYLSFNHIPKEEEGLYWSKLRTF